ncbi:hypothetical protein GPL15_01905 [Clostridium sp. MCC353]|uniref:hypothetical protein n=1 Tax=Clostridium sp. MCC353 TaxID=2592646 RepID=UPI001C0395EF|nr:hypothetical protein [Clostridium sp. MCC353]MBT9775262.1 hypothetical protein [Clostridium sp. MCC353]
MTAEEIFNDLSCKYGDDFSWILVPLTNRSFVTELKEEIGSAHFLYYKQIWAVVKCESNDDVLYAADNGMYYIFHLTYSSHNTDGFPKCREFTSIDEVKVFLEKSFLEE